MKLQETQDLAHDYTRRYWGHDYCITNVIDGGMKLEAMGWGHGLHDGDFILLENERSSTRYRISSVHYMGDPSDMWSANLEFAPRPRPA